MVEPRYLIIAVVVLAILNGIMSPFLLSVFLLSPLWYPSWAPFDQTTAVTVSSLLLSSVMLMVTGVPAALYERFSGAARTSEVSAWIWLAAMLVATLPSLPGLAAALQGGAPG